MTGLRITAMLSAIFLLAGSVMAQDGPGGGIAFVQAPEMSSGVCTGRDSTSVFACARQKCIEGGGTAEDCIDAAYCFPARTSVDIFVQHKEGLHWHEYFCGLDSKESALAMAKVVCDKTLRPDLIECMPVLIYDDAGRAEEVQN